MKLKKEKLAVSIVLAWLISAICFSCAKSPYINIDYRLPGEQQPMITEKPVSIEAVDVRDDKVILNEKAQKKFDNFSGQFSLNLRESDSQKTPLGNYTLPQLFETAITHRLNKLGVPIADQPSPEALTMQIEINQFQIGLVEGDWLADISYKASLIEHERQIASETVTGSAQRLKGVGRGGAEKVIGEIFTDVVNRLDIEKLFKKATVK